MRCDHTGYRGRLGIYEVMPVTDGMRKLILEKASADEMRSRARSEGMRTLREDGLEKIRDGVTSVAEVLRVAGSAAGESGADDPRRQTLAARLAEACAPSSSAWSGERLQLDPERQLDQPVREPDVLRQQGAVQVGADHVAPVDALEAVAAVVAVARQDAAQRPLARAEVGAPAVVLEAGDHARAGAEIRLDGAVADQARPGSRTVRRSTRPDPGQLLVA